MISRYDHIRRKLKTGDGHRPASHTGFHTRIWGKGIISMVFSSRPQISVEEAEELVPTFTEISEEVMSADSDRPLVSASDLPPASDALAALFPEEAASEEIISSETPHVSDLGESIEHAEAELAPIEFTSAAPEVPSTEEASLPQLNFEPIESAPEIVTESPEEEVNVHEHREFFAQSPESSVDEGENHEPDGDPDRAVSVAPRQQSTEKLDYALHSKSSAQIKSSSDWAFEEKLASHREWVESQGASGKRADLANSHLEGTELIGVNLRFADLHDVKLKGTDLLLADLRDTCLVRADLQDCCLTGANLEGANLENADLESSLGLVARQLAGANLRDAAVPPAILEFDAIPLFDRATRSAYHSFVALMAVSMFSAVAICLTKDTQLVLDSGLFSFSRGHAVASALPTNEVYLIAPVLLFILYFAFHFHLQRLWTSMLELPAVFPDGTVLGEDSPRIIAGLLRVHFRWMDQDSAGTSLAEKATCGALAYAVAPAILFLYWARYLTLQDFHGTVLQAILAAGAAGMALYAGLRVGRPPQRWAVEPQRSDRIVAQLQKMNIATATGCILAILLLLSLGTIEGVPHDKARAPQFSAISIRRWAPTVFWAVGFDPYAKLPEAAISTIPPDWSGADDQVTSVQGASLNGRSIRYAQAYGAFLANAHLFRGNFQGAFLAKADLRGADLGQTNLRLADLGSARLSHANLDRADLRGANLERADFRGADLSYTLLDGASLVDGQFGGASLYNTQMTFANLSRVNFEKADLRSAILEGADLEHADLQQAYLWSAKLAGAHLRHAQLNGAIFIAADLRGADLDGAQLQGTVLNEANLTEANLAGADMRGVLGLTVNQVCSTKHWQGALLDDVLQMQVDAKCPSTH